MLLELLWDIETTPSCAWHSTGYMKYIHRKMYKLSCSAVKSATVLRVWVAPKMSAWLWINKPLQWIWKTTTVVTYRCWSSTVSTSSLRSWDSNIPIWKHPGNQGHPRIVNNKNGCHINYSGQCFIASFHRLRIFIFVAEFYICTGRDEICLWYAVERW